MNCVRESSYYYFCNYFSNVFIRNIFIRKIRLRFYKH